MDRRLTSSPLALLSFLIGLALMAPAGASASDIVYGTTATSLVRFNATTPQTIDATLPLQGLPAGVTIAGLDERPESTSLNALGSDGRLYRVGKTTGVAELIAAGSLATPLTGAVAMDFNPTVNRLRIVTSNDHNLRQNPNDGVQVDSDGNPGNGPQPDTSLTAASQVAGIAYDRNNLTSTQTTLFGIDAGTNSLVLIGSIDGSPNSPNGGIVTAVGPIGRDVTLDADLDVARGGTLYASLPSAGAGAPVLARVNATTGAATVVGPIGAPVRHIAVADPPRVIYVHGGGTLVAVPGDAAAAAATAVALQVPGGQTIVGLDTRPSTGELLALSSTGIVYRVNRASGALTAVGQPGGTGPAVADAGFDVNPASDRPRITTVADQNVSLRVFETPFAATTLVALTYSGSDPNFGQNPNVVATAFNALAPDATTTTLFGIDVTFNNLVRESPPESGVLETQRGLGIDFSPAAAFDLPSTGTAGYAVTRIAGAGNAHLIWTDTRGPGFVNQQPTVDLGELRVGGTGSATYNSVAIARYGVASVPSTAVANEGEGVARVIVARAGGNRGAANVEYDVTTGTATGADLNVASGTATFEDGESTATIAVPITNDGQIEGAEAFTITLARPGGAVTLNEEELSTRITILSDDPVAPGPGPAQPNPAPTTPLVRDTLRPVGLAAIAAQRLRAVRRSGLRLRLLASEALTARVVAVVDQKTRRRLRLKSTTLTKPIRATFTGPQARKLRLRLTAAAKRRLARARSVKLTVRATLTDRAGNVATVRERVTLRR